MKYYRIIFLSVTALALFLSCKSKQKVVTSAPIHHESIGEHSLSVLIVMYDKEVGKDPLLKAIEEYKAEIVYDYNIITGMAIKKPADKTLEETMTYFKKVKGVLTVEYDRVTRLTDPVRPKLEVK